MSANLPRNNEPGEEDNLLVEAVSLLVQRQRETEKWVAEQLSQAEERTAATERRYTEVEARLAALEEQLSRVAREVEPTRADTAPDERLTRLRAQLEALKSGGNGVPAAIGSPPPRSVSVAPDASPAARAGDQRRCARVPAADSYPGRAPFALPLARQGAAARASRYSVAISGHYVAELARVKSRGPLWARVHRRRRGGGALRGAESAARRLKPHGSWRGRRKKTHCSWRRRRNK